MNFLSEDRAELREQLRGLMDVTDGNGQELFPNQDTPGTPEYTMREVFVRLMETQHQEINTMAEDFSPRTAQGGALDKWARYFGMSRSQAQAPRGEVLLTSDVSGAALERLAGSRTIPEGTRLRSGTIELETTERVQFGEEATEAEVKVEAASAQSGTAVQQGADVDVPRRQNISGEALTAIDGGESSESDQQLRFRLARALRAPSTFEGLTARMLGHSSVDTVEVDRGAYGPGTAEVYVNPAVAYPDEQLRRELESLANEGGPSRGYVIFPEYEGVTMQLQVDGAENGVKEVISDYVANLEGGDRLVINDIEQRARQRGATDVRVLALRRGPVGEDRTLLNPRKVQQVTNLRPGGNRTQWYTRKSWITLC